jgi:hypothetical protein
MPFGGVSAPWLEPKRLALSKRPSRQTTAPATQVTTHLTCEFSTALRFLERLDFGSSSMHLITKEVHAHGPPPSRNDAAEEGGS